MSSSEVNISRLLILAQKCNNFYLKDDVKLCLQYKDTSCKSDLQSDLNNFQTWCSDNFLDLNCSKRNAFKEKSSPTFWLQRLLQLRFIHSIS
nr:uncharacterized protein LOC108010532 isoform X5 [Drosophila suzukii]